jgi:hypothetical protein
METWQAIQCTACADSAKPHYCEAVVVKREQAEG